MLSVVCHQDNKSQSGGQSATNQRNTNDSNKDGAAYACLLKNELLGAGIEDMKEQRNDAATPQRSALLPKETKNLFQVTGENVISVLDDLILPSYNDDEHNLSLQIAKYCFRLNLLTNELTHHNLTGICKAQWLLHRYLFMFGMTLLNITFRVLMWLGKCPKTLKFSFFFSNLH